MASIKTILRLPSGTELKASLDPNLKIADHFKVSELANNKAYDECKFLISTQSLMFIEMVEEFRRWFNKSMTVSSCYRTPSYNKSVGGDANSAHLQACAMDWWIPGHTELQRNNVRSKWEEILKAHNVIGAINFYTNGYHLEAFSNLWYGQKAFTVRDYRKKKGDW